jgi:hypothetical protein
VSVRAVVHGVGIFMPRTEGRVNDVPVCDCHGEPMYWHKRSDRPTGADGRWRCRTRTRQAQRRYEAKPERQLAEKLRSMIRVRTDY